MCISHAATAILQQHLIVRAAWRATGGAAHARLPTAVCVGGVVGVVRGDSAPRPAGGATAAAPVGCARIGTSAERPAEQSAAIAHLRSVFCIESSADVSVLLVETMGGVS